jgi:two-component system, response regulator RegA
MADLRPNAVRAVLFVDDDELMLAAWRRSAGAGRRVLGAHTADAAIAIAKRERLDMAIVDMRLGMDSGIVLVRDLHAIRPSLPIMMCSAYMSIGTTVAAMRAGATEVFQKPITFNQILRALELGEQPEPEDDDTPTLARVEWEHICRVLDDCQGNVSEAARRLGIYRSTLQRKLRQHTPRE